MSPRSVSRGLKGRWAKPANEREVDDGKEGFNKPTRRDTSKERTKERANLRGGFSLSSVFLTRDSQPKDPKGMGETISRVYSHALVCSRITAALHIITKSILWMIVFFLFKSMIQGDGIALAIKTFGSCIVDKEVSCSSKFGEAFFPDDKSTMAAQHWVSFQLADSGFAGAHPIYKIAFPLLINNPVVLLIAAIATAIAYWVLGYIYSLLIDIADTADAAAPQRKA